MSILEDSGFWAGMATAIFAIMIFLIVFAIFRIIISWKIFEKAGEPGWKALIPIYNTYIMYKITWNLNMFWVFFGLSCFTSVLSGMSSVMTGNGLILAILNLVVSIVLAAISIVQWVKLGASFGKDSGFIVGLVFLNTIFEAILAFGSSEYIGPDPDTAQTKETD